MKKTETFSKLRKRKQLLPTQFGILSAAIIEDRTIGKNARMIYALICSKQGTTEYVVLSTKDIETQLIMTTRTVKRAIKELKDLSIVSAPKRGYLAVPIIRTDGTCGRWGAVESVFMTSELSDKAKLLYLQYTVRIDKKEGYSHVLLEILLRNMKINRNHYNTARQELQNKAWIIVHYGNSISDTNRANRVFVKNSTELETIKKHQLHENELITEVEYQEQTVKFKAKKLESAKLDTVESAKLDTPISNQQGTAKESATHPQKEKKGKCYAPTATPMESQVGVTLNPIVLKKKEEAIRLKSVREFFNFINAYGSGGRWLANNGSDDEYFDTILGTYGMEYMIDKAQDKFARKISKAVASTVGILDMYKSSTINYSSDIGFRYIFKEEIFKIDNDYNL